MHKRSLKLNYGKMNTRGMNWFTGADDFGNSAVDGVYLLPMDSVRNLSHL